jgi:drug/metabolite transporter (DMT)-like permease
MSASDENTLAAGQRGRGIALGLLSTLCFTANILLIRAVGQFQAVNIWMVTCIRFAVGLAVLAALYGRGGVGYGRVFKRKNLITRGLVGGLAVAVYYVTVVHIGAGRATFINNMYIVFAAVIAVWLLREHYGRPLVIGSVAALVGLALLTNPFANGAKANPYDLLAIGGAFCSAYVVVTIRRLHAEGETTPTIFAAQCVYGLLICAVPAAYHIQSITPAAWALMSLAGVCAAVGQLAFTGGFRHLSVAEGSLLQMLVPLGIAAGGYVFFHEYFSPHEMLGAALIVGGTMFTMVRSGR